MYRLEDGSFQRKTALIRLLEINEIVKTESRETSAAKRMAKIIAEVSIDLSQHVGQGDLQIVYPFQSPLVPSSISVECTIQVKLTEQLAESPEAEKNKSQSNLATITQFHAGLNNVENVNLPPEKLLLDKSLLMNDSRLQRGGQGDGADCCESRQNLEAYRMKNE